MTRVAVLGTGRMGGAIAHRLRAGGFQISVWDRTMTRELFDSVASQAPDLDLSAIVNAYSTDVPQERQKEVSS